MRLGAHREETRASCCCAVFSLVCASFLVQQLDHHRNKFRLATMTSALNIYLVWLSISELCVINILLPSQAPHITLVKHVTSSEIILPLPHGNYHEPAPGCTILCFALLRTLQELGKCASIDFSYPMRVVGDRASALYFVLLSR